jgi:hypothetical protein
MNSAHWRDYFHHDQFHHQEPDWNSPVIIDSARALRLAASLARYQLVERSDGTTLLKVARRAYPSEEAYCEALALYVRSEGWHGVLLERLIRRLGGQTLAQHWSHALFSIVRRALGARVAIEILVVGEIVCTSYFRLLRRHVGDPVVRQVCEQLLRDEAVHLDFHRERLAADQQGWGLVRHMLWAWRFRAITICATTLAWLDHGKVLRSFGGTRREFHTETRRERGCLLTALARSMEETAAESTNGSLPLENPTFRPL